MVYPRSRHPAGLIALALLPVTAGAAQAQSTQAPSTEVAAVVVSMIQPSDWIHKPSTDELFQYLPKATKSTPGHRAGDVTLKCKAHPNNSVSDCIVVSETNPKQPFGQAAVLASRVFRIKAPTLHGQPIDNALVLIPLSFDITVRVPGEIEQRP